MGEQERLEVRVSERLLETMTRVGRNLMEDVWEPSKTYVPVVSVFGQ